MNAPATIDIGPGYDRLAAAMDAEGVRSVTRLKTGFRVELTDGRVATGFTPRGAISNAMQRAAA